MDRRSFLAAMGLVGGCFSVPGIGATERRTTSLSASVLIVGGGTGGVAAALAACRAGQRVVLTEETLWIGGQFTSQAVPPDEHPWIEEAGCTRSYRQFRDEVRQRFLRDFPLNAASRSAARVNPGGGWVSRLCHEPRLALAVLESLLAPHIANGRLTILLGHRPVAASVRGDRIESVVFEEVTGGRRRTVSAPWVLEATELGDLLPLAGVEHVTGAESRSDTGEPSAPELADPLDQQAITWCFALEHHAGQNHPNLWTYRRIRDASRFQDPRSHPSVCLVNWPQNDHWLAPLVGPGVSLEQRRQREAEAKALSRSLIYWLQTEAPRPDGGTGWPGLKPSAGILGTSDGFALAPYIRESRRIRAKFTVTERHVSTEVRKMETGATAETVRATPFPDSVGVGAYRIDLHPSTRARNYVDVSSLPFQIPLGALLPRRVENLIAAGKCLGVTHIANGCYRLHPVEWNIGEAAGALAAFCLDRKRTPAEVYAKSDLTAEFQKRLRDDGFELEWQVPIRPL